MKRTLLLTLGALALAACNDAQLTAPTVPTGPAHLATTAGGPRIDPQLTAALASAVPTAQIVTIVNYDPGQTTTLAIANRVMRLGAGVMTFRNLSMLVTIGTPAQIQSIAGLPGVQSVYANRLVPTQIGRAHV